MRTIGLFASRAGCSCGLALLLFLFASKSLQNAVAEGDTRTISMHHIHTGEDITITYKRDGTYDEAALEKLNWFLRDWRRGQQTRMDPHLIDLVWDVQRETGSKQPIWVVCGYRSPQTNAMLRRRSAGVARFSQHTLGHAMDFYIPGVPLEELRVIGLRLQRGGVGFYPTSGSPFVHMDTGNVRMWPRMTRDQLLHVFPDGRTVQIATDGNPLPGYALALADIRKRGNDASEGSLEAAHDARVDGGAVVASNDARHADPIAKLLELTKNDEEGEEDAAMPAAPRLAAAIPLARPKEAKPTVLAALGRNAEKKAELARAAAAKLAKYGSSLLAVANAKPLQTTAPSLARTEAPPPSQVIAQRGYWEGPADGTLAIQKAAQSTNTRSQPPSRAAGATDALGALSLASDDRLAPKLALSYAAPADRDVRATPALLAIAPATPAAPAAAAASPSVPSRTTIALKRGANQAASTVISAATNIASIAAGTTQLYNPWLRAIVLSPSVQRFLTTATLGDSDFRSLASLLIKPDCSVMMTFTSDPNLGLSHDHFSGSAVVFVSTVTYPTQTAALLAPMPSP
ncbi:MAG TPA: DUF882 domain-containing protein [Xanthobacteraceae bacterium]